MSHDLDDDFAVYPFRRIVVEEQTGLFAAPRIVPPPPVPYARPRRSPVSPLRWAVPLAFVVFVGSLAGTAAVADRHGVKHALGDQIVPAAEAAAKPTKAAKAARHDVVRPRHLFVPDVTDLPKGRALKLLKQSKFRPHVRFAAGKPGVVLEQRPKAATEVRHAGVVVLVVGRTAKPKPKPVARPQVTPTVIVTSVVGLPRNAAVQALLNEGLGVKIYGVPSRQAPGTVVAQSPRAGARAEAASYVRINVAVAVRR